MLIIASGRWYDTESNSNIRSFLSENNGISKKRIEARRKAYLAVNYMIV